MQNMKGAMSEKSVIIAIVGIIALAGVVLYLDPSILSGATNQINNGGGSGNSGSGPGGGGSQNFAANIRLGLFNAITSATANTNCELLDQNKQTIIVSTNVNGPTSMSATSPSTFNGYAVCGNDNFAAAWRGWTDRGTEYYLSMFPISYKDKAGDVPFTNLKVYPESTPTWTGIDTGTVEATTNVTVGSGQTVDTTEVQIQIATAQTALGNPDFNGQGPLALCANTTLAGLGEWNAVRPLSYSGTVPIPQLLGNRSVINGQCYVLSTNALVDDGSGSTIYKFGLRMQAKPGQDPGVNQAATPDQVSLFLLDKAWTINDQNVWVAGYDYESAVSQPADVGMDSLLDTNVKDIFAN